MKIVFATNNPHKLEEVNAIAKISGIGVEFISPPLGFNPKETGNTFEENSFIKAFEAQNLSGQISLADDSGLCVNSLNGAPGLYSARYAGSQQQKIEKLLNELDNVKDRTAKFVCYMTLIDADGNVLYTANGICNGKIIDKPKGDNGFGYDPIFLVDGSDLTMAQMSNDKKNKISHRANALNQVLQYVKTNFNLV